jgi:RNA polymerase sigma factor (sigma-70 family)
VSHDLSPLIEQARRGDRSALAGLYDRFAPLVRTACFDRTGDWHAAMDLTHDVFLAALNGLGSLAEPQRFRSWLLGITRNKLADYHRRQMRTGRTLSESRLNLPSGVFDPGEQETQRQLLQAVANLPQRERFAVELFYFEGLSAEEVARLLTVSLRTVYAQLLRARQSLRHELEKSRREAAS